MGKERVFGFDVARALSMFYIVGVLHLSGYTDYWVAENPAFVSLIWSTLGVFTFLSAYLLGSKYKFHTWSDTLTFYRKRVLRFYPLFIVSSLLLLAIGFNTQAETWKGILGISCLWKPQQHTLWYISTLMLLYFLTPLFSTDRFRWPVRFCAFILITTSVVILDMVCHSVDPRLFYYLLIYYVGLTCASSLQAKTQILIRSRLTLTVLIIYLPLFLYLFLGHTNRWLMMVAGYIGILVIMNLSMLLSNSLSTTKWFVRTISFVSYGSMCAYLFHREFYWLFLLPCNNSNITSGCILAYLFFITLPIILFVSYWIQKKYDSLFAK